MEDSAIPHSSLLNTTNGRIVLAAQEAIDRSQKNLETTSQLRQKQLKLYKRLMKEQKKKEEENNKRQGRKKKHIDLCGIIDNQCRVDGMIRDTYKNKTIQSKKIGLSDWRYKNQGGMLRPSNFTEEQFNVLYNVTKLTLPGRYWE